MTRTGDLRFKKPSLDPAELRRETRRRQMAAAITNAMQIGIVRKMAVQVKLFVSVTAAAQAMGIASLIHVTNVAF
jgi:hypothetical protein